jgi:hypothetical protein
MMRVPEKETGRWGHRTTNPDNMKSHTEAWRSQIVIIKLLTTGVEEKKILFITLGIEPKLSSMPGKH